MMMTGQASNVARGESLTCGNRRHCGVAATSVRLLLECAASSGHDQLQIASEDVTVMTLIRLATMGTLFVMPCLALAGAALRPKIAMRINRIRKTRHNRIHAAESVTIDRRRATRRKPEFRGMWSTRAWRNAERSDEEWRSHSRRTFCPTAPLIKPACVPATGLHKFGQ